MRRKWTRETITTAILGIHYSGDSLSYTTVMHNERALLRKLRRATMAHGRQPSTRPAWTNDSYRRHRKPGESITAPRPYRNRRKLVKPSLFG